MDKLVAFLLVQSQLLGPGMVGECALKKNRVVPTRRCAPHVEPLADRRGVHAICLFAVFVVSCSWPTAGEGPLYTEPLCTFSLFLVIEDSRIKEVWANDVVLLANRHGAFVERFSRSSLLQSCIVFVCK